jgi:hypothetical protein
MNQNHVIHLYTFEIGRETTKKNKEKNDHFIYLKTN